MKYLLWGLFWIIGLFIGTMGLGQIMIILRLGIPFTIKLNRRGALNENTIIKQYIISLILLTVISGAVTGCIYAFASQSSFYAYLIGAGVTLVLGFGKYGMNGDNLKEYIKGNARYFNAERIADIDPQFSELIITTINEAMGKAE